MREKFLPLPGLPAFATVVNSQESQQGTIELAKS